MNGSTFVAVAYERLVPCIILLPQIQHPNQTILKLKLRRIDIDTSIPTMAAENLALLSEIAFGDYHPTGPTCFLDLPRELRDVIYNIALVRLFPVEVTRDHGPVYRRRYQYDDDYEDNSYEDKTFPENLSLQRVSKQISIEASEIFYGQEWRFTGSLGWNILEVWLTAPGMQNRQSIKFITVSHPGVRRLNLGEGKREIRALSGKLAEYWSSAFKKPPYCTIDPTDTLLLMKNLRHLRFLVWKGDRKVEYGRLRDHEVNDIHWLAFPSMKKSILNMVSKWRVLPDKCDLLSI